MSFDFPPSRRAVMAGAGAAVLGGVSAPVEAGAKGPAPVARNPLVRQRADAQVFRHDDGDYYMTASVPEYDRLVLRRARTLAGLATAPEAVIWRRPGQGKLGGYIWAPELHQIDGRWHMYFAAGDAGEPFHIRTYVLRCRDRDALTGRWEVLGQLQTPWDTFTLDSTVFSHHGVRYLCWAQQEPGIQTNSNLYLAPLATPLTLARPPVRLSTPTLPWEIEGYKVNEAPAVLARNGRLFVAYSASATDARYCLGLLTADTSADLMSPGAWSKSQTPVFVSSEETGVYGPGHNSFTVDEQGRDVLVFHGRDYKTIQGDPLFDPNRHTRVQRLYYGPDGTPDFGVPVGAGEIPDRYTPLDRPGAYLRLDGTRLAVGEGALATTQFRQKPGSAEAVVLEPILKPGQVLHASPGGEVVLGGAADDPARSGFRRVRGLADGRGVSFVALAPGGGYLRHRDGAVVVGPVEDAAGRASATFLVS
ncbi:family 43 glycosylhydrolase [Caulobacter sp. UNC279MFTsu5.1]|uniref:family 43 glycosylhydrolase n=1 Tax=Caulobacter sp. UNC279MFTsu5.1 TaxID=1502775 RepID=UPI0008DECCE4|nr:family 43 glycosylhydrolase [Caulobacter sp. UNC279MFTsu5.1]SFK63920.1 Beta-xylosidase, GH43 family [Caulobacter sp. UNC279MFTsu5.1]